MANHGEGNGRTGRNVALPDENRPSWRPQDDAHRNRRAMSEDDDRYDDDRYMRGHWEDRDRRDWDRDRRYAERGGYGPRGYGYGDGDRPRYDEPARRYAGGGHRGKGPANYQRSDERIREMVCEALTDDDRIDASSIEVAVKSGEVTLSGTVPERHRKRLAEDLVEGISGVRDVQNQIRPGDHHT